jgi:uncharacterized membrane protein YqjE
MQSTEMSFAKLVEDAFANVQEIIRSEVRLAKAETKQEAAKAARAGAVLGSGIALTLFALGFLLWSAVYGLWIAWPAWLAALAVGVVLAIAAGVAITVGRTKMREVIMPPARTVENVRENLEWVKHR